MLTKMLRNKDSEFFPHCISVFNMIVKINSKCFSKGYKNRLMFVMEAGWFAVSYVNASLLGSFIKWLKITISVIGLP